MLLALAVVVPVAMLSAQPPAIYPVDDTERDPTFRTFVQRLRTAVEARNTKALRKLTADDVICGPDKDDKGWKKFVGKWHPDDPQDRRLWLALADMLAAGFVREHPRLYLSPYQVWRFPSGINRATHLVIARDKSAMREQPSLDARVVATLSFDIVRSMGDAVRGTGLAEWRPVRTLAGVEGFVMSRDLVSPLAPRAQFGLDRGRWQLIALEED
ncbi:MAG: hypothetical protein JNL98_23355 [Bryobacterales bacterium]|nr:hypothetical protein [Bryobacterales bacterium]